MKPVVWMILMLAGCGGRVAQATDCAAYVQCVRAVDAQLQRSTNLDRFLADGACWVNAETGELCETGCRRGLEWTRSHQSALPQECLP